ncbi:MAG: hypothetical protein AAF996_03195 [Pseudomonadota bacterium]
MPELIEAFTIGGDSETDWLFVSGVTSQLIQFETVDNEGGDGVPRVKMIARMPITGNGSLVSVERTARFNKQRRFLGVETVDPEQVFCLDCTSENEEKSERCIVGLNEDQSTFTYQRNAVDLPKFPKRSDRMLSFVEYTPQQRVYSLRTFARPLDNADIPTACEGSDDASHAGDLLSGIVFYESRSSDRMSAAMMPPAAGAVGIEDRSPAERELIAGGDAVRVRLYRVRYAERGGDIEIDPEEDLFESIAERRSFIIRLNADGALSIRLDTPESMQIKAENIANTLNEKRAVSTDRPALFFVFDSTGLFEQQAEITDALISFRVMGAPLARYTLGKVNLPLTKNGAEFQDAFLIPRRAVRGNNRENIGWGEEFSLGQSAQAQFVVQRLDRFAGLSAISFTLLIGGIVLMCWMLWFGNAVPLPSAFIAVALGAQVMLGLRILVSLSGEYIDPAVSGTSPSAILIFTCIPIILRQFVGARMTISQSFAAGFIAFLVLLTLRNVTSIGLIGNAMFGLAIIALAVRWLPLKFERWPSYWTHASEFLRRLIERRLGVARFASWAQQKRKSGIARLETASPYFAFVFDIWRRISWPFAFSAISIALLMLSIRLVMSALSWKEAIPLFGERFSNSIWYIPIAILVLTYFLRKNDASPEQANAFSLQFMFAGLLGILFVAPAILINDFGIVIFALGTLFALCLRGLTGQSKRGLLHLAIHFAVSFALSWSIVSYSLGGWDVISMVTSGVAILTGIVYVLWPERILGEEDYPYETKRARWGIPFVAIAALLLAFNVPTVTTSPPQSGDVALDQQMSQRGNSLRLLFILDPDRMQDFGTAESARLSAALAHYADYTDCPNYDRIRCRLFGQSFLGIPKPTELLAVHMDDNVSAVHLTAQFGRLAALGMILMLFSIAAFTAVMVGKRREEPPDSDHSSSSLRALEGLLTRNSVHLIWTVAFVALYMVLANYRIVPFTGQNIFFLSAASGSDAIFGLVTFALIALGLREDDNDIK